MIFFWLFMPELKGRTLEEIDELFAKRVPARRFKSFKTTIQEDALVEIQRHGEAAEKDERAEMVEDAKGGGSGLFSGRQSGAVRGQ